MKKIKAKKLKPKVDEISFWKAWIVLNELDREKYLENIVPIIERHWKALDQINTQVESKEVTRLKAALLNSYFTDLERACKDEV